MTRPSSGFATKTWSGIELGLTYDARVAPAIRRLPPAPKQAIRRALDQLALDRFSPGLDVRLLRGPGDPKFRIRVGDHRIAFVVLERETRVLHVFHRSEGYGWLERLG